MCATGAVTINGITIHKPNHPVRVGDAVTAPQGRWRRAVRVAALGRRRGPAAEAQLLYEEAGAPMRLGDLAAAWEPLLAEGDPDD